MNAWKGTETLIRTDRSSWWFAPATLCLFLCVVAAPAAALMAYTQDFEGLDPVDPDALRNDGWLVFGNVYQSAAAGGALLYEYGPNTAPNHNVAFSQLAGGEGGPDQGSLVLNVFNDYNNQEHVFTDNVVESNVFQEQIIGAADVGTTWRFRFDAKPSDQFGPQPPSTAVAFIKTVGLGTGLTNFLTVDTAGFPSLWQEGEGIDITIDASLVGQFLQFGFLNTSTQFSPTGVFYDNVSFSLPEPGSTVLLGVALAGVAVMRRTSSRSSRCV